MLKYSVFFAIVLVLVSICAAETISQDANIVSSWVTAPYAFVMDVRTDNIYTYDFSSLACLNDGSCIVYLEHESHGSARVKCGTNIIHDGNINDELIEIKKSDFVGNNVLTIDDLYLPVQVTFHIFPKPMPEVTLVRYPADSGNRVDYTGIPSSTVLHVFPAVEKDLADNLNLTAEEKDGSVDFPQDLEKYAFKSNGDPIKISDSDNLIHVAVVKTIANGPNSMFMVFDHENYKFDLTDFMTKKFVKTLPTQIGYADSMEAPKSVKMIDTKDLVFTCNTDGCSFDNTFDDGESGKAGLARLFGKIFEAAFILYLLLTLLLFACCIFICASCGVGCCCFARKGKKSKGKKAEAYASVQAF